MNNGMEKWMNEFLSRGNIYQLAELDKKMMLLACRCGAIEDLVVKMYPAMKSELERLFMENYEIAKNLRKAKDESGKEK